VSSVTKQLNKPYLLWITSARDSRDHAVSDSEFDAGSRNGHYRALCHHDVIPMAMTAPPGQQCSRCALQRAILTNMDHSSNSNPPRRVDRLTSRLRAALTTRTREV